MSLSRRGFLAGLGAVLAAPAVVHSDVLMPLRGVVMRDPQIWTPQAIYEGALGEYNGVIIRKLVLKYRWNEELFDHKRRIMVHHGWDLGRYSGMVKHNAAVEFDRIAS